MKARLAICEASYGCSDADDEVEAENGASSLNGARRKHRRPQEAAAETIKSLPRRLDEKLEDELKSSVLEGIDRCLDEVMRACEKTATDLLKGDGCICHDDSITAPMMKAVGKINAELPYTEELDDGVGQAAESPPKEELPHKAAESPPEEEPPACVSVFWGRRWHASGGVEQLDSRLRRQIMPAWHRRHPTKEPFQPAAPPSPPSPTPTLGY